MKIERVQVLVRDTVASTIGAGGMAYQIFFIANPDIALILLCLGILLAPGTLALLSMRGSSGGDTSTIASGSQSQPPSSLPPSSQS